MNQFLGENITISHTDELQIIYVGTLPEGSKTRALYHKCEQEGACLCSGET